MELILNNQPINEIENTICGIEGVQAARIVADGDELKEVHVLSSSSKNSKNLCRDIESAILAKHGIAVDYRKISIAQVGTNEEEKPIGLRPAIKSVGVESVGLKVRITVCLESEGKDYEGMASGPASSLGKIRLIAKATLNAVEKLSPVNGHLDLETISVINLGDKRIVTSCVILLTAQEENAYVGSALINETNENQAIVKSILNALNRKFGYLS